MRDMASMHPLKTENKLVRKFEKNLQLEVSSNLVKDFIQ